MSVITNFDPVPNRIRSLVRLVAASGRMPREQIPSAFMPGSERKADQVNSVLREAIRMKLLREDDGEVALGDSIKVVDVRKDEWFAEYADRRLVGCELEEGDDNRRVAFAVAWTLTRSLFPSLEWRAENTRLLLAELEGDEVYDVTNQDRMAMVSYWARYAGYGEAFLYDGRRSLLPDPTRAITRRLGEVFGKEKGLPITVFMERLASLAPLLEGGSVRSEVERRLRQPRATNALSQSTTLALLRLEKRGILTFKAESDAAVWLLSLQSSERRVSHVERL
jgi:hypothetical protein